VAKVCAENKAGTSDWSEPISVSTQSTVPSVPSEPLCSSIGFGFIGVTWSAPAETGGSEVTSYTLELEEGPEGAGFIAKYNGPNTGYVLQGARPLLPYRFRVKAGNAVGWSHFSSVLEVMGSCGASGMQKIQKPATLWTKEETFPLFPCKSSITFLSPQDNSSQVQWG
jgi:hypothetical protein